MLYNCNVCNYSTNRKYDYNKHLNSNKHKKKVNEGINTDVLRNTTVPDSAPLAQKNQQNMFTCDYCHNYFSRQSSLTRHLKVCIKKKTTETELKKALSDEAKKNIELARQNNELKHMILYFEDILSTTTKTLDKSVTAISFANINFPEGLKLDPPKEEELKTLYHNAKYPKKERNYRRKTMLEQKKLDDRKLYNNVSYEYAGGTKQLAEYITHVIVEIYKKDNPNDQSIWNSDSARLNFIIRDVIENTDKTKWHIDKKGVKVTRIIIDPIINELKNVLEKEIVYSSDLMAKNGGLIREDESRKLNRVAKIIQEIDEGVLQDAILKKMAGHFYLNKDLQLEKVELTDKLLDYDEEDKQIGSPKKNPLIRPTDIVNSDEDKVDGTLKQ